jgi:hypothetical protein
MPLAVERLRILMSSPMPQLVRIGVRNKGCAGLSYNLEYIDNPAKFVFKNPNVIDACGCGESFTVNTTQSHRFYPYNTIPAHRHRHILIYKTYLQLAPVNTLSRSCTSIGIVEIMR